MAACFHGTHTDELDLTETPRCAACFKRDHQPGPYVPRCAVVVMAVCCSVGRSPLHSCNRGRCRACAKPYCLLRLPLCSLNHSMICRVVLSCASVASRSPLPLLCMAISPPLDSQLREWWRGSAASKYAAPRCDREWTASAPASWSEAGYSGDVAVMGRRGGPRVLRWARPWPLMTGESAGPCGVLAPSLDAARRCLCRLIGLLASRIL